MDRQTDGQQLNEDTSAAGTELEPRDNRVSAG